METNVKPGQRVVCVKVVVPSPAFEFLRRNTGAIGTVHSLNEGLSIFSPVWRIIAESTWLAVYHTTNFSVEVKPGEVISVPDSYLRPLLWDDDKDETLEWAGHPPNLSIEDLRPIGTGRSMGPRALDKMFIDIKSPDGKSPWFWTRK